MECAGGVANNQNNKREGRPYRPSKSFSDEYKRSNPTLMSSKQLRRSNSISTFSLNDHSTFYYNPAQSADGDSDATRLRWLILLLSCGIMFGNYYAYDNPAALNRPLQSWMQLGDQGKFNYWLSLCYSIYSFPNIILPLLAGTWMESYGLRKSLIVLSVLVCLGQAFFAQGITQRSFHLTLIGRFLFGLGGECLAVAQARLVTEWFVGRELALALGMNLSVARVGTIVNNISSAWIYERWGIRTAVWVGFAMCVVSMLCSLCTIILTSCARDTLKQRHTNHPEDFLSKSSMIRRPFWLLLLVCFLYFGAIIPYNSVASDLLARRNVLSLNQANVYMSMPDFIAMFIVPALGMFVDSTACKYPVILTGGLGLFLGHLLLACKQGSMMLPLSLLGIGYSCMLVFWALVPDLVGRRRQAMAYGLLTGAFNAAVSIVPLFVPLLVQWQDGGYTQASLFFSILALLGVALTAFLLVLSHRRRIGGQLYEEEALFSSS